MSTRIDYISLSLSRILREYAQGFEPPTDEWTIDEWLGEKQVEILAVDPVQDKVVFRVPLTANTPTNDESRPR